MPTLADVGTNAFAVRVTDSAGFVDEAALQVRVLDLHTPPALAISENTGNANLQLSGIPGQHYRVETAVVLPDGPWEAGFEVPALPTTPHTLFDLATNGQRFYRAVSLP
jgi:hypothetical protein